MACSESRRVNVGYPSRSHRDRVSGNKSLKRGLRDACLEVRCVIVPMKQSNVCGGKDVR